MTFEYQEIPRIENISGKEFRKTYIRNQQPVVVTNLIEDWPAFEKWHFDYIKEVAGDKIVPLYNNDPVDYTKKFNEPVAKMTMKEYLELLEKEPTDLRIFLYNLMKEAPQLQNDFSYPDLGIKLLKGLPMLFFGGTNSNVFMHYDIDLANIFHFHFHGKKECVILPPAARKHIYKIPHSLICREDIDWDNPDFEKWPALQKLKPYKTTLNHGEMLYMPEGWWHYMKYVTPGFSMSLRSIATKPKHFATALYNIFIMRHYDNFKRKQKGQAWIDYKNEQALKNVKL